MAHCIFIGSRQIPVITKIDTGTDSSSPYSFPLDSGATTDSNDFLIFGASSIAAGVVATYAGKPLTLITSLQSNSFGLYILSPADTVGISGSNTFSLPSSTGSNGGFGSVFRLASADPAWVSIATGGVASGTVAANLSATDRNQIALGYISLQGSGVSNISNTWSGLTLQFSQKNLANLNGQSGATSGLTSGPGTLSISATPVGTNLCGIATLLFQGK